MRIGLQPFVNRIIFLEIIEARHEIETSVEQFVLGRNELQFVVVAIRGKATLTR